MDEPLRILRVLIVSALILLGVKTIDIATAANQEHSPEEHPASASEVKMPNPEAPKAEPHESKAAESRKPEAAPPDISNMSRSEVELLQNLAARRLELEERGRELDMREKLLRASEQRIDERIAELKGIEANIQSLLQQRDQAQEAQLMSLVKVYEGMKPADAARIFDKLEMEILLPVAQRMKPQKIGQVMAAMDEDAAKRLTVNLARHLQAGTAPEASAMQPASETPPG